MKPRSPQGKRPSPSTGPTPQLIQHASAVLIIDRLLPQAWRPLQVEARMLERFSALMAAQGWSAHVSAMAFDRIYAHERFMLARRRGTPELAAFADELLKCLRRSASRTSRH